MKAIIVIIAVLTFFALLLFIPSYIDYTFCGDEYSKENTLIFKYLFIKIKLYPSSDKKSKKTSEQEPEEKQKKKYEVGEVWEKTKSAYNTFLNIKDDIANILLYAKNHAANIKLIDLKLAFDREEPMTTGIMTGVINGAVYNILALLDNSVGVDEKKIEILPLFANHDYFRVDFHCIVRIKNVHIMVIAVKFLKIYFKIKKQVKGRNDTYGKSN